MVPKGGGVPPCWCNVGSRVYPPEAEIAWCCCVYGGVTPPEWLLLLRGVYPPPKAVLKLLLRWGGYPLGIFLLCQDLFQKLRVEILYILVVLARLELNSEDHF